MESITVTDLLMFAEVALEPFLVLTAFATASYALWCAVKDRGERRGDR